MSEEKFWERVHELQEEGWEYLDAVQKVLDSYVKTKLIHQQNGHNILSQINFETQ